jgi:hypothetical protein
MSNFPRQWPTGIAAGAPPGRDKLVALDENLVKAPNFSEGSTHVCSNPIYLDGEFHCTALHGGAGDIEFAAGKWPKLTERTVAQELSLSQLFASGWATDAITGIWENTSAVGGNQLRFHLPRVAGGTLQNVYVRLAGSGAGSSHVALPQFMPTVAVVSQLDGVVTALSSATDASASVAAYNAAHTIGVTVNYENLGLLNERLFLAIAGGSGTGAVANALALYSAVAIWRITELRLGG